MKKTVVIGLIIVVLAVLIDQISKVLMVTLLVDEGKFLVVIPDFFKFKLHYNPYIAFSMKVPFPWQMAFTVLATGVFGFMAKDADFKHKKFYSWGVYMMIGGMIGNFIDRIFNFVFYNQEKGVIDFLSFTFFKKYDFAVFNIADSFLVVGVICVIIDILFCEPRREKLNKQSEITE